MTNDQIEEATRGRRCFLLLAEAERDRVDLDKRTNIET